MQPREGAFASIIAMPDAQFGRGACRCGAWQRRHLPNLSLSAGTRAAWLRGLAPDHGAPRAWIGGGAIGLAAALALRAMGVEDVTIAEPKTRVAHYLANSCEQEPCTHSARPFHSRSTRLAMR